MLVNLKQATKEINNFIKIANEFAKIPIWLLKYEKQYTVKIRKVSINLNNSDYHFSLNEKGCNTSFNVSYDILKSNMRIGDYTTSVVVKTEQQFDNFISEAINRFKTNRSIAEQEGKLMDDICARIEELSLEQLQQLSKSKLLKPKKVKTESS